ncbi:prolyl oligopeptidase family serine peptidase [Nakamurella sp. YIM 132087]|uniref:prolyl oligopeptidase n=1 Tax=Nakamurella alba TaxID=2665158 RepID=A0A7K1FRP1_9ACTN|nr:prolyl oligopeptidase family serine peptidase [Nakamurella alba]MTD16812.1 prolyl oligopeptidase family serine peptidase [Nakamurella alba]
MEPVAGSDNPGRAPVRYPVVERDDVVDTLHGVQVIDPYRYLEDPDADRTRAFVDAQNAVTTPYLDGLPARETLLAMTTSLLTAPRRGVPWERGGRYFVIANPGEKDQDQLFVADTLDDLLAGGRLLLDPNDWSADGTAALTGLSISKASGLLAWARADAGSDWRTIGVLDTATGEVLDEHLIWTKWVDPTWLPDGRSFLYWRYPAPVSAEDTAAMGAGELVLHRLGTPQDQDELVWSRPEDKEWMADPWVSDDGRWLVLTAEPGTDSRSTVEARRLSTDADGRSVVGSEVITVVGELADAQSVVGSDGDLLFLRTERDAPTGRLVTVDLADPAADWVTLLAGDDERVLAGVRMAADSLLVLWSVDAAHRVVITDRSGGAARAPELPGPASVTAWQSRPTSDEIFVGLTSFAFRHRVFRLTTSGAVDELPAPDGQSDQAAVTALRLRATSADGTQVPMSVVHRADLGPGPHPTLLYGYGGFDVPVLPSFSAMFASWVAAGGVLAVANLRGGGEFGQAWHEAGMLEHKQRVFDDLYGCAEHLVAQGWTTTGQLAVHGRSNGGLLVGAAMTQRPELWAAALPTVGVLDMLRFHLFTIGWAWTTEYGSPDDEAMFRVLLDYSPLHRLMPGTSYPPTLICTGDHDDRVVPAHSLKFGAQLQFCQASEAPVLLRVDTRAGHGMGKPARALALEYADQLAFAAHHTGLVVS